MFSKPASAYSQKGPWDRRIGQRFGPDSDLHRLAVETTSVAPSGPDCPEIDWLESRRHRKGTGAPKARSTPSHREAAREVAVSHAVAVAFLGKGEASELGSLGRSAG